MVLYPNEECILLLLYQVSIHWKTDSSEEGTTVGLEGAQVSIFADDTLYTTAFSDETGAYMVMGLEAGSYDVTVDLEGYDSQTVADIDIVAAIKTEQHFELNAAAEVTGN